MRDYSKTASQEEVGRATEALRANGFNPVVVGSGAEAKAKVFELIPEGSKVMNMTSITLQSIGVDKEILESGKYDALALKVRDEKTSEGEKRAMGAAPDFVIGSVHAITQNGEIIIASATGSQLPAYAYGAKKAIFVVGIQKIVENIEEGTKRIDEYVLPLESDRARKAYGVSGSVVAKLLILNKELQPDRIHVVIVNESLGF